MNVFTTDVAIIGGGIGGCAAALAIARLGYRVVITEKTKWLGGQLTSEAVPPDEHPWIEAFGATASYRALRNDIRMFYRRHLPLTSEALKQDALNPGNGWVGHLCHDPRVSVAVLNQWFIPYEMNGSMIILRNHVPVLAQTHQNRITRVIVRENERGGDCLIEAPYFIDATPLGDLLALADVEHVTGAEAQSQTHEPHAREKAEPLDQQSFTMCFAMDYLPDAEHFIEKPRQYEYWRDFTPPGWPNPLLNWRTLKPETHEPIRRGLFDAEDEKPWWGFRRILDQSNFVPGFAASDITIVNWPQIDFRGGPLCGVSPVEAENHLDSAKQLSLSFLYWLQTEAPREDGGTGYRGLRLRRDVVGGAHDGLALSPYTRESRRIHAEFTVLEQHISFSERPHGPELFSDSVGTGCYRIDLHPSVGGQGYLDIGCWAFQIPLGSLIPVRMENLLPGGKNLGVTHVTNGAFRVHHVEWNIGESAGLLATFCLQKKLSPRGVRNQPHVLQDFQALLSAQGIPLQWAKPIYL